MSKATPEAMGALHGALAEHFADILKNGELVPTTDSEGNTVYTRVKPGAAMMAQIRQFLKDNHIEATAVKGKPLAGLLDELPFDGEDTSNVVPLKASK